MQDLISRQAAIDTIESWLSCDDYNRAERHIMRAMQSILYDLPSVKPQQKTGQWQQDLDGTYLCSECGSGFKEQPTLMGKPMFAWCPLCGAKMIEPQESEDKE